MSNDRQQVPLRFLPPVALAIALSACAEEEAPCLGMASPALAVRVVDEAGAIVPDAKLESSFNDRPMERVSCKEPVAGGGCSLWDVGRSPGTFVLQASRADGSSPTEKTVIVANSGTASCPSPAKQDIIVVLVP